MLRNIRLNIVRLAIHQEFMTSRDKIPGRKVKKTPSLHVLKSKHLLRNISYLLIYLINKVTKATYRSLCYFAPVLELQKEN